ncbi:hypothetical protein [Mycobacterium sp. UM_Kg27]|uniref:hypothetical protein n=1 Tax=Mycobacterium sp. UM_Kg27 TaxID=1545693 RepID=UPI000A70EAD4|nr:hypothetical protein [Mycobacterium sp. UM_Kg27]
MSRTDAHAPFHVRVARREITVVAVHRCGGRDCDLPDRSTGHVSRCYWLFHFTGVNVCSCWMCHSHNRPEDRRSAVRARLRGMARAWNGGDRNS